MSKKLIRSSIFVFTTVLLLSIEFTVHTETETESYLDKVLIENVEVNQETCEKSVQISAFNDAKAFQVPGHEGGDESTCDSVSCINSTECGATGQCLYRTTCDGCGCKIKQTGYGGSSRCGD